MRLDETVDHYLLNVEARRYSIHTQIGYRHDLSVMVRLLADLCHVVDLERVTILHLRQCVHHLLNTPVEVKRGRPPENGLTLSTVAVGVYIRRWKTFFSWCFAEVVTLRVEDVHETYISVFGKGRRERQVGIHSKISNLLWKYVHKYRRPAHPGESALFLSIGKRHAGLPLGRGGINGLIGRLKKATGIDEVRLSAHTFRHTFAVMYLDEGGDLFSLSREMGHKDVKTTEKYLRSFTSKNARMQHNDHSPLNAIELRSERRRGKGQKKKPGR